MLQLIGNSKVSAIFSTPGRTELAATREQKYVLTTASGARYPCAKLSPWAEPQKLSHTVIS
jgi:hypothetical protein